MTRSYQKTTKYSVEKFERAEIKISNVKLSESFVEDVKKALEKSSREDKIRKLREVSKNYGHFYAKRIVFGGAIIKSITDKKTSKNRSNGYKLSIRALKPIPILKRLAEKYDKDPVIWSKSLENPNTWAIIGYDEITSIYDLLDEDLKNKVLEVFGQ
ncbi:13999_t:CDS:2, partial [Acaulospora colombiana]